MKKILESHAEIEWAIFGLIFIILAPLMAFLNPGWSVWVSVVVSCVGGVCFYASGLLAADRLIKIAATRLKEKQENRANQWTEEELKWAGKDKPDVAD